jgi:proline iminopeptidase
MKTFHFFTMLILFGVILLYGCENDTDFPSDSPVRQTGTVLSNGTQLTYFIEGKGYPCIVVTEGELMSKALSNELKNHFKFIFLNARVNMADPGEIDSISFDLLTRDVEQVRLALKLDKVGVFGHSISGLIALEYARNYPEHTVFVIMNGTPPYWNDKLWSIQSSFWASNASGERKNANYENWKGISSDALNALGTSDARKYSYILDAAWNFYDFNFDASGLLSDTYWNKKVWDRILSISTFYNLVQVKPVEAPVFLALGKFDFRVPYIVWNDQKEKIPNLTVHLFEKSGHYSFYEEEELFRTKVLAWMKDTVNMTY